MIRVGGGCRQQNVGRKNDVRRVGVRPFDFRTTSTVPSLFTDLCFPILTGIFVGISRGVVFGSCDGLDRFIVLHK